ncbi:polyprenyl synthetase family protein [Bacteroides graminisolvens]|uniref:Octaprenyl-diphosphate synthase n=1 Tax=Bacteroides graminisolvens DSM 19988 = JCM 15093 TaxID=1121097 RepID=A0A069CXG6_9BACE|nr:polyprenyl synthetase family protein [Bacteroides graminisolvens]GAK35283.1 octaprenyl-diphosphate synthase [Bacteroides graminisolvens DSM 19988 = JCM 15093]
MDVLSLIKSPIIDELEDFKNLFDHSLSSSNPLLTDVIVHLQQRNGKMMRPILVLLIAKLYGKVSTQTLHAAVSLELLHTASLVHDDVVDESAERRGQLSVNAIFNNKVAVLTGDFLLATCLVQASKTKNHGIIDVVSKLGQDLAEGELLQLSNINNTEFSESVYFDVINKKTAALFASCTKAAALSAQVDNEKVELARLFGEYIGICFQIKDDIFDYFDNADIGKPTGNDMFEGKLTLPVLFVLNNGAGEEIKRLAIKVKQRLASHQEISDLVSFTKDNGGILYAQKEMTKYKEKALDLLSLMPDTEVKESLRLYLDYVVDRHK